MAKKGKGKGGRKKPAKRSAPRRAAPKPQASPTVVQLAFVDNERNTMAKGKGKGRAKGKDGKPLHGAALAAHRRAMGHHGGSKSNPAANPGHGRRRRRRNPNMTFVQALGKLAGGAAAMFGSGVLVTIGVSKIAPGSKWSAYGIPAAAALLGAGIATRYPLVGVGVGAGAAAPFVLPVAQRMLQPGGLASGGASSGSTVSSLRAVAMGSRARLGVGNVRMGDVRMGRMAQAG